MGANLDHGYSSTYLDIYWDLAEGDAYYAQGASQTLCSQHSTGAEDDYTVHTEDVETGITGHISSAQVPDNSCTVGIQCVAISVDRPTGAHFQLCFDGVLPSISSGVGFGGGNIEQAMPQSNSSSGSHRQPRQAGTWAPGGNGEAWYTTNYIDIEGAVDNAANVAGK